MRLVEDDQVPVARTEQQRLVTLAPSALQRTVQLQRIHRRDQVIHLVEGHRPVHVLTIHREFQAELVLHFLLPLQRQARRWHNQHPPRLPSLTQRVEDHPRFDRFAQPHLIGDQVAPPRAGDHSVRHADLMRQQVRPRVAQLAVAVADQQLRCPRPQVEAPWLVELAVPQAFQRRLDLAQLTYVKNARFRQIRRLREDRRAELHLRLIAPNLLHGADTIVDVERVRADHPCSLIRPFHNASFHYNRINAYSLRSCSFLNLLPMPPGCRPNNCANSSMDVPTSK